MESDEKATQEQIDKERERLLERLHDALDGPMVVLAFVWLALFVVETLRGASPFLIKLNYVIWAIFWAEFLTAITIAPSKTGYLKTNWLKLIALLAPAFRIYRVVHLLRFARLSRLAGATRGLRLIRLLSSINRGMNALGKAMKRRGFGYVVLLTMIVTFVGAAGMYGFEAQSGIGIDSYGTAVWWTAMIMTTMGSEFWPQTAEGRVLCLVLAIYAFAVFGYVTATLASYFVGRDAEDPEAEVAGSNELAELKQQFEALRMEIRHSLPDNARSPRP
jgi:voltage-gated potassium channel